jgi:hypothetical protein
MHVLYHLLKSALGSIYSSDSRRCVIRTTLSEQLVEARHQIEDKAGKSSANLDA